MSFRYIWDQQIDVAAHGRSGDAKTRCQPTTGSLTAAAVLCRALVLCSGCPNFTALKAAHRMPTYAMRVTYSDFEAFNTEGYP